MDALGAPVLQVHCGLLVTSETCTLSSLLGATNKHLLGCRAAGGRCRRECGMLAMMDGTYVVVDVLGSMAIAVVTPESSSFWLVAVVAETYTAQRLVKLQCMLSRTQKVWINTTLHNTATLSCT